MITSIMSGDNGTLNAGTVIKAAAMSHANYFLLIHEHLQDSAHLHLLPQVQLVQPGLVHLSSMAEYLVVVESAIARFMTPWEFVFC